MKTALVFGASGQIGAPLLERLGDAGWRVLAVSREARSDAPGRHWLQGDFARMPALPAAVDAVFSCGPLDLFARWLATAATEAPRVVAFGSTSVEVKCDSSEPAERDVARRLREAEAMRVVDDAAALAAALVALFDDAPARARMARNAAQLLEDGRGALERTLALIAPMLPAGGNRPD